MYIVLMYDITMDEGGARVQRNTFKICKKYLTHIQMSVFEGNLSELNLMKLKKELEQYIRDNKDSLIIFKSRDERWLTKEFLGLKDDKTSNFF
ncbi:CRISPR-associated endonuclease Cas2 [Proteiniborus sp. MB09-C3]|uniref:CRISPR-associated endonuclease Cas2 n=1 Tax=Proteiniborus sp. MB09-C3 TaxID=3050072 RepID=UPI002556F2A7|nr:CRISPR-associated endonuclease Cas2 [Proteiniborus sp. MB09-C3]WIV11664.1 CRISPR-associated endonuclease Cas2 [Proteiniborus sp. MB09-C3]